MRASMLVFLLRWQMRLHFRRIGRGREVALAYSSAKAAPPIPLTLTWWRVMFVKRYFDYDLRSYQRGYYFNLFGIIRVLKFNVATVMQKPDWIFIIEIFGREYILS
jgi:hypothetical protein